jgi:hypothetical protein
MILSTFLNLFLVPVIYVLIVNLREGRKSRPGPNGAHPVLTEQQRSSAQV